MGRERNQIYRLKVMCLKDRDRRGREIYWYKNWKSPFCCLKLLPEISAGYLQEDSKNRIFHWKKVKEESVVDKHEL